MSNGTKGMVVGLGTVLLFAIPTALWASQYPPHGDPSLARAHAIDVAGVALIILIPIALLAGFLLGHIAGGLHRRRRSLLAGVVLPLVAAPYLLLFGDRLQSFVGGLPLLAAGVVAATSGACLLERWTRPVLPD